MSNSLITRSVTPTDFAQWEPLWERYNSFYGRTGATALPDAITKMTWSRFFDAYEPVHAIVAESDGQLVGLVHYIFHRNTIMFEPTCYLQDLFTLESVRGQGIGRVLIGSVYARAKVAGVKSVYWHTRENNVTAMKLYDKLANHTGFVVYRKQI